MAEVIEAWPSAAPLDDYLREVVQTLHAAVNQGMRRASEDPRGADRQIKDCEEILDVIMAGHVQEWL